MNLASVLRFLLFLAHEKDLNSEIDQVSTFSSYVCIHVYVYVYSMRMHVYTLFGLKLQVLSVTGKVYI